MKKAISVILSAILVFSVLSVNAFAFDPYNPSETLTEYLEMGLKVKVTVFDDFEKVEQIIAFKDNKFSFTIKMLDQEFKGIFKDNTLYLYPANFPFIHIAMETDMDSVFSEDIGEIEYEPEFIRSYTYEDLTVYEYKSEDILLKCYVENNDELIKIESIYTENQYTTIEILETGISDKEFDLPLFSFNLMPIFEFLSKIGLFNF